jgi:enoyl-CoA hydratase
MSQAQSLLVEDRDQVRWILFNRPDVHNAQNVEMLVALEQALDETARMADIRALVLGGTGPSFCSGHDLREVVDNADYRDRAATAEGRLEQERRLFVRPIEQLSALQIPTICRVQGHCRAAGLMFVAACDLVVAADTADFGSSIIPALAVNDAEVPLFAWLLGERRAKQALWLGETMTAAEALTCGLVNWVVPAAELDARVADVVGRLLTTSAMALALSKQSFRFMARRQGREDFVEYHYLAHQLSHQTTDAVMRLQERVTRLQAGLPPVTPTHRGTEETDDERN